MLLLLLLLLLRLLLLPPLPSPLLTMPIACRCELCRDVLYTARDFSGRPETELWAEEVSHKAHNELSGGLRLIACPGIMGAGLG